MSTERVLLRMSGLGIALAALVSVAAPAVAAPPAEQTVAADLLTPAQISKTLRTKAVEVKGSFSCTQDFLDNAIECQRSFTAPGFTKSVVEIVEFDPAFATGADTYFTQMSSMYGPDAGVTVVQSTDSTYVFAGRDPDTDEWVVYALGVSGPNYAEIRCHAASSSKAGRNKAVKCARSLLSAQVARLGS